MKGRGGLLLAAGLGLLCGAALTLSRSARRASPVALDADSPTSDDVSGGRFGARYTWYDGGSARELSDTEGVHRGFRGLLHDAWPQSYQDPSTFPVDARRGRRAQMLASMMLADADAPSGADGRRSTWFDAGATRDDQFTRIPLLRRKIQGAWPQQYPDPSSFPVPGDATAIEELALMQPGPAGRKGFRVFHGTHGNWDVEGGSTGTPRETEGGWSLPSWQYNPANAQWTGY